MADLSLKILATIDEKKVLVSLEKKDDDLYLGDLQVQFGEIDIGEIVNKILSDLGGADDLFEEGYLTIDGDMDIGFISQKVSAANGGGTSASSRLAIQAKLFGQHFQYGASHKTQAQVGANGGQTKNPSSFFFRLDLSEIANHIPNINSDDLNGYLFLGFSKGETAWFEETKPSTGDGDPTVVVHQTQAGFYFGGEMKIGDFHLKLTPEAPNAPPSVASGSGHPASTTTLQADPPVPKKGIKWIDLKKKKVGPITLRSFGFQMKGKSPTLFIKADIKLGPLLLSFMGLGVEVNLSKLFQKAFYKGLSFKLLGMGLDFKKGALEIAALFVKQPNLDQYIGGILIKTKAFGITGIGAYGKVNGHKSVFGFLFLEADLGGPPSFFVQGIAIAFGYNRDILIPPIDQVSEFPLVKIATGSQTPPDFDKKDGGGERENPLVTFSESFGKYIPPKEGEFFFGIGVKFQTYELVHSFAMLIIKAGEELEFAILGLSKLSLPPVVNDPIVYVEIAFKVDYKVSEGVLRIDGRLTEHSYVLSKNCHLTGGFAFYAWFKGDHAGDFVITVGGYHPRFNKPDYYPHVPRLSLNWQVCKELSISGSLYQALTGRAIMAGGGLHAVWKSGILRASFDLSVDFLIQWKPFHYDASLHISVEAGIYVHWHFIHKHVSISIGADLHIWGPSFSGHAHFHVRVCHIGFSFSIDFGGGSRSAPKLEWTKFLSTFLPEDKGVLNVSPTGGLIKKQKVTDKGEVWLINPKELEIRLGSIIPISKLDTTLDKPEGDPPLTKFTIPVWKKNTQEVTSTLFVNITSTDGDGSLKIANTYKKNYASALWLPSGQSDNMLHGDQFHSMTGGIVLVPGAEGVEYPSQPFPSKNFDFDTSDRSVGVIADETATSLDALLETGTYDGFQPLTRSQFLTEESFSHS